MKTSGQAAQKQRELAHQIDELLPQTQCTQCGYNGCLPYAQAVASNNAKADLCKPGGNEVAKKIAKLISFDFNDLKAIPKNDIKVALIDEERCVGCYKCIEVCPVDAIIGSHGCVHTVQKESCTGCNLCLEPCPVDCINLVDFKGNKGNGQLIFSQDEEAHDASKRLRTRFEAKKARPSLRSPVGFVEHTAKQLADKAMNKARRKIQSGANK